MVQKKGKMGKSTKNEEDFVPKAFQKSKRKEKNNKNKSFKKQHKKNKFKKIIFFICLISIIIIGIIMGISAHKWKTLAQEMLANENSIVIDIDGNEIAKLGCERKNETTSLTSMPNDLKNAYVAIEDERFYSHGGIDIKRTGRCDSFLYRSFWKIFLWWKYYHTAISKKFNR